MRWQPACARGALASIATMALASSLALADDIKVPTDPVAKAAFDVLEKSCSRCHQEGRLTARERPAKNFGFILRLDQLAQDPNYILPGNPYGSKLFKEIVDEEMPYDVMYEGSSNYSPTPDDVKALETWIKSLGANAVASCEQHKFITNADMVGFMAADLDKLPRARVSGTRYLTLTHLKNACTDDQAMNVYRQGMIKLINSLSRSSDVIRLQTIDPEQTIIRINIDDLGWSRRDWETVLAIYPYNIEPDIKLTGVFRAATGTQLPYVRGDWFVYYASRPPLYDALLRLGENFAALTRNESVDVQGDIMKLEVARAGFQKSGVSQNNRLIERHSSRSGYFWTSYDFRGNEGVRNLFEHPLGPGGPNGFQHDGGETIFSLPNGFQAYYLNTSKGQRLDKGPTDIVRDLSRKDLAVTNGVSCMGCHDQGMRKAKDDIRSLVLDGTIFPKDERDVVEAIYPPHDKMDQIIADDGKRFIDAETRAGIDPALTLNGVEMINVLSKRYEDDVDLNLAAASLGLTKDQFTKVANDADRKFKPLLRRLEQATVPFDQFEASFRDLADNLTDDVVVNFAGGPRPLPMQLAAAVPDLSLISDRDSYRVGDTAVFTVVSSRDCTLTLTDVDERGVGTVLLPNKFQPNSRIRAGVPVTLPDANAPFQYRLKDRGIETVIAVCNDSGNADGIRHDFAREAFTTVPDYTSNLTRSMAAVSSCKRSIAVEAAPGTMSACGSVTLPAKPAPSMGSSAGSPKPSVGPVTTATAMPVSESARYSVRAAIKISVR